MKLPFPWYRNISMLKVVLYSYSCKHLRINGSHDHRVWSSKNQEYGGKQKLSFLFEIALSQSEVRLRIIPGLLPYVSQWQPSAVDKKLNTIFSQIFILFLFFCSIFCSSQVFLCKNKSCSLNDLCFSNIKKFSKSMPQRFMGLL